MIGKDRLLPEKVQEDLLALSKVHITQNTYMILNLLSRNSLYGLPKSWRRPEAYSQEEARKLRTFFLSDEKTWVSLVYPSRTLDQFILAS